MVNHLLIEYAEIACENSYLRSPETLSHGCAIRFSKDSITIIALGG